MAGPGVQFKTFEARRYQDPQPKQPVRVDHNSTLTLVQPEDGGLLRVDFAYTTSYGPIGMIKIEGTLLMPHPDAKPLAEKWNKDRNLPAEGAQQVHSAILSACVPQAVVLAKDLRMPPPIPVPQVRFQQGQAQATTEPGPDAA